MAYQISPQGMKYGDYLAARNARNRSGFLKGVVLPVAAAAAPAAFGAIGGAAGASGASVPGAVGASAAPLGGGSVMAPAASKFTLGGLMRLAEVGVPAVTGLLGMRSRNRANERMFDAEQRNYADQMTFARDQEAYRRSEADRVAKEEQRRWDIEQSNRAREIAAAEEDRAYQRRLLEEREARNNQRRMALTDFLRMGR